MKHSLMLWTLIVVFSLVIVQCYATETKPKLACDETTYNFGEVVNTKTIKHTFILRNEGDALLEVSRVSPGCGCTTAEISTKDIAPGEKATLDARFDLHGRKGRQKIDIRVMSNAPEQPILTLFLKGTAVAEVEIKPSYVYFENIAEKTTVTKTVDIIADAGKPFKIIKAESNSPYYDVALEKVEEGKSYRLYIDLKPQLSQKNITGEILVFTDNPNYEKIPVRVSANIVGLLTIRPEEIALVPETDFPMTRYIIIRSAENKPFKIESVKAPISSIQTELIPMDENGYRIKISNIKPIKELDGKNLLITTNLTERKEILIPFRIISGEFKPKPVEIGQRREEVEHPSVREVATHPKEKEPVPVKEMSLKEIIISEGKALVNLIRTCERLYFAENKGYYTDKWEDISGAIDMSENKYFTTPPTITVSGEGKSATFTATVTGSGEAQGVSVSINQKGEITVTGLK